MAEKEEKPLVADPCPWCGKSDVHILSTEEQRDKMRIKLYWIYCRKCGCAGPNAGNAEEAVERWNKRILTVG